MSNKAWRTIAFSFIIVPVIIRIIIAFIVIYVPISDSLLIFVSDFIPIIVKIQWIAFIIAVLISIFKIKKDDDEN